MSPPRAAEAGPIAVLVDREGLGDVLLKRPFLEALAEAFPRSELWWIARHQTSMETEVRRLVGSALARVVSHAPIDGPALPTLRAMRRLPQFARVFDSRTKASSVALARFALRPRAFYCCLPGFALCDGRPPPGRRRPRHIAWRMNAMLACATGRQVEPSPLVPGPAAIAAAEADLPAGAGNVGIAPGSRDPAKNWPLERYLGLARDLATHGLRPVFFLGPQESTTPQQILAGAPDARVLVAQDGGDPDRSLERLVAQGRRLKALVANDSGVGHLIGAAGTPVVSLFGPTRPDRWAPLAPKNLVLWSEDFGAGADLAGVPVEAAASAVLAILGAGAPPPQARIGAQGMLQAPVGKPWSAPEL